MIFSSVISRLLFVRRRNWGILYKITNETRKVNNFVFETALELPNAQEAAMVQGENYFLFTRYDINIAKLKPL